MLAQQLKLGKNGIEEYLPLGELSAYEQKAMDEAVTILQVLLQLLLAACRARCAAFSKSTIGNEHKA